MWPQDYIEECKYSQKTTQNFLPAHQQKQFLVSHSDSYALLIYSFYIHLQIFRHPNSGILWLVSCACNTNVYSQAYTLKIPHCQCVYELRGVIVYDQLHAVNHYRAFFRSLKDPMKWFHANDSTVSKIMVQEYIHNVIKHQGDVGQYSDCSTATPFLIVL